MQKNYILSNDTIIRKTTIADIPQLREIFVIARQFMANTGNPSQWVDGFPSDEQLTQDIENGDSYVVEKDEKVVATFVLRGGIDPTYNIIYEGKWLNDKPYGVIHRIAAVERGKGVASFCIKWCLERMPNIRIDTHKDNIPMQKTILKNGFQYCGIIFTNNGTERLAYQSIV